LPSTLPVTFTVKVQEPPAAMLPLLRLMLPEPAVAVTTPPQEPETPLGVATTMFAGRLSVNATPASVAVLAVGLVMVYVNVAFVFGAMSMGENDSAIAGGATTISVADAVAPVPPLAEVTALVVLFMVPAATPVTLIVNEQVPLAAMLTPLRLTAFEPAAAVAVPPQVLLMPFGDVTTSPLGKLSLKATPESPTVVLELFSVNVSVVPAFNAMLGTPKAFASNGGATTVMFAEAVVPGPLSVEEIVPVVLDCTPAAMPVTFTLKVQEPRIGNAAPARLTPPEPAVAVIVPPPQEPVRPLGEATTRPAGNVSVNATAFNARLLGLLMLKVSVVEPFSGMVAAPKAFEKVGGVATLMFAEAVLPVPPLVEVTDVLLV